jgi:hypothetical protein
MLKGMLKMFERSPVLSQAVLGTMSSKIFDKNYEIDILFKIVKSSKDYSNGDDITPLSFVKGF